MISRQLGSRPGMSGNPGPVRVATTPAIAGLVRLVCLASLVCLLGMASGCAVGADGSGLSREPLEESGWDIVLAEGPAPIRHITRRSDGRLIGPRSSGHEIEIWTSDDDGASWVRSGSVTSDPDVDFGDVTMLRVPQTSTIFCAFRETIGATFRVTLTRSDDDGQTWAYDSTPVPPVAHFVGEPFLFLRATGDLQIYYSSEALARANGKPGHQWIAMRGRRGMAGDWDLNGEVIVSRETAPGAISRDGMVTVVQLGADRLMAVIEGVEPFPTGGARANLIHAAQSWDGGIHWDASLRRVVYRSHVDPGSARRYNAYVPYGARVGGGPVGVAFCTDEETDGLPPDPANAPVEQRRCRVGYVQTTTDFESWSAPTSVWTETTRNYTPGLFELAPNQLIVTIDAFEGRQRILARP